MKFNLKVDKALKRYFQNTQNIHLQFKTDILNLSEVSKSFFYEVFKLCNEVSKIDQVSGYKQNQVTWTFKCILCRPMHMPGAPKQGLVPNIV